MGVYLHIMYKSIVMDPETVRAKAMIKRMLQVSLYFPVPAICGVLFILNKILTSRMDLKIEFLKERVEAPAATTDPNQIITEPLSKWLLDDTEEEIYHDVPLDEEIVNGNEKGFKKPTNAKDTFKSASWFHASADLKKVDICSDDEDKKAVKLESRLKSQVFNKEVTSYNPYQWNPLLAGADFCFNNELFKLMNHFHPTIKLFAEHIINDKMITYSGNPLKDFCFIKFLERFSFKNPKGFIEDNKKRYVSKGSRGISVHLLTSENVPEEEKFIFEYLKKKHDTNGQSEPKIQKSKYNSDDDFETNSIGDDEFDSYLQKLGGDKDEELNYMEELGYDLKNSAPMPKTNDSDNEDADDDMEGEDIYDNDDDDNDDDDNDDDNNIDDDYEEDDNEESDNENDDYKEKKYKDKKNKEKKHKEKKYSGKVDKSDELDSNDDELLCDFDDDGDSDIEFSDIETDIDSHKNNKTGRKRKAEDFESLFANADDFAHLLEETGSSKEKQGTSSNVFNNDKSSIKQLKWEKKQYDGAKSFRSKKFKK